MTRSDAASVARRAERRRGEASQREQTAAGGDPHRRREQRHRERDERRDQRLRVDDGDVPDDVEVDDVRPADVPQVQGAEPAGQGQRGLPLVLERRLVEGGEGVVRRVVVARPVQHAEAHPGDPSGEEELEVAHDALAARHLVHERRRERVRRRQVLAHQQAVAGTRLVHEGRRRRAGAVEVEGDADGVGPGVVAQERPRSQQSLLLTVGEQEDDVVARRRARAQGACRLQEGGDAAAVVRRPDRGGHGVVVGHEQDGTRGVGARQAADHVVDHAGDARIDRRDDLRRLRVRVQAQALEMPPDVVGGGGAAPPIRSVASPRR